MRGRCYSLFSLFLVVILSVGCSMSRHWPWPGPSIFDKRQTLEGPLPLIDREFETVNLVLLLDPTVANPQEYEGQLSQAYQKFYNVRMSYDDAMASRNELLQPQISVVANIKDLLRILMPKVILAWAGLQRLRVEQELLSQPPPQHEPCLESRRL